jgi:hypothetical protein
VGDRGGVTVSAWTFTCSSTRNRPLSGLDGTERCNP